MSLTIAVDFDDVMVNFMEGVLEVVERDFGATIPIEEIDTWADWHPLVNDIIGRDWWAWLEEHA